MEIIYKIDESNAQLHISKNGNSKVGKGIATFSTLPGDSEHMLDTSDGRRMTDIEGTCSHLCKDCFLKCYAKKSAMLHHNVNIKAWGENTVLLRSGKVFSLIDSYISGENAKYYATKNPEDKKISIFRINVSGEIESLDQFVQWNELAKNHPEVTFSAYTKNFDDLGAFMDKYGDTVDNFVINVSEWHGVAANFIAKYPGKFNVFEYDDSNLINREPSEDDRKCVHCPAVTKAGHHATTANGDPITCDHCQRCYKKTGATTKVWSH